MIQQNGKVLLNLESTVGELVELVEGHYAVDRVIADYGITMVNQPLQNPTQLKGLRGTKWGEAYPVGYQPPYDIYIWTRPAIDTENVADGTWFNVGKMAIPGPQGEPGVGERGETGHSTRWYIGEDPLEVENPKPGDIFMVNYGNDDPNTGTLYIYSEAGRWGEPVVNIRGPKGNTGNIGPMGNRGLKGEKGDKGDKGDTAPVVALIGITDDPSQIAEITPSAELLGKAWVLTKEGIATIWTVIETSPTVFEWQEVGVLSGFTAIMANGQYQTTWNADTKLDKLTTTDGDRAYVAKVDGGTGLVQLQYGSPIAYTIPMRDAGGVVVVGTPKADQHATTKKYVDDGLNRKVAIINNATTFPQVYCKPANGVGGAQLRDLVQDLKDGQDVWTNHDYTVAQRDRAGAVRGPNPTDANQYATKSYVDNNSVGTLYRHDIQFSGYGYEEGYDGDFGLGNTHTLYAKLTIYSTKANYNSGSYPIPSDYYNLLTNGPGPITIMPTEGSLDNNGEVMTLTFYSNGDIQIGTGYQGQVEEYYWIKGGFENGYQDHIVNRVI